MSVDYVQAFYVETPNASGSTLVDGPCALHGFWVVPGVNNGSVACPVEFRDGGVTGTILLKVDVGPISQTNTGNGMQWVEIPGQGIRFSTDLTIKGGTTTALQVESITGFVSGAKPDAIS